MVTGDSGQTLPSALVHPTVANTKQGYRIYRMADALQAAAPIFMRLDFGSAAGANTPGIWVTIGTGSNGSGTITNLLWNGGASTTPNVFSGASVTQANNSYGSADTSRFALGMFCNAATAITLLFTLERTKDSSGNASADGLLLCYTSIAGQMGNTRYLNCALGPQPSVETALSYILTQTNPSQMFAPENAVGVAVVTHYKGASQQPGMNLVIVNSGDVTAEGQFAMTIYGAVRTYQQLNAQLIPRKVLVGSSLNDSNARCCMRYD